MTLLLNTLFVTADKASVHKRHDAIAVLVEREAQLVVPLLHLQAVVCIGPAWVSPEAMAAIMERGGHVAFLDPAGRMLARVEGIPGGNVHLRRAQYRAADDTRKTLQIARAFVAGKVVNQRQLLLHAARDSEGDRREQLSSAAARMAAHLRSLEPAQNVDQLRGVEGIAAREYFAAFPSLIRRPDSEFKFEGRTRRPPRDRVNALLSFGYALLLQDCIAAACAVGLDPAVGYLHEDRSGRMALALDLMEELRSPVVDRLVLALVNRRQLSADEIRPDQGDGFLLTRQGRKTFISAYHDARQTQIQHPFLQQTVVWGRIPQLQALLLARVLRGDLDTYPPLVIR